jgi:LmbE family N-acetylglucosaminyl deacetylase
MTNSQPRGIRYPALRRRAAVRALLAIVFTTFLLVSGAAQTASDKVSPLDPLPQDSGVLGLKQSLLRLKTTARLLQTTAHPDDEDGGMLTLESRGKGVNVTLLTLTRGEGGQNKVGSNLFDVLGVVRTLELMASDRYYGVEQRFTRAADFGYSKNPDEAFQKWQGHDVALGDMVRVIRTSRPDVLVARFSGTERDGHGHHQASAMLTKEAFRAAADPKRFPEQIAEGLQPWQAKKLYVGNVCGFGASTCPAEKYTIRLNTGEVNPALGMSYIQFAMLGLKHQLSQGAGGWSVEPGDRFTYYKLVDSVLPPATDKDGHEHGFFEGIDISLPALASRLGVEEKTVPFLRPALEGIEQRVKEASERADQDPSGAVQPLLWLVDSVDRLRNEVEGSSLGVAAKQDLAVRLDEKEEQAEAALNWALNVSLEASVLPEQSSNSKLPSEPNALPAVSPGQKFTVRIKLHNGSKYPIQLGDIVFDGIAPAAVIEGKEIPPLQPGHDYENTFKLQVPAKFAYTRPALHRNDPERDSVYTVDEPQFETLPVPPFPFRVVSHYDVPELATPTHRNAAVQSYATLPTISAPVVAHFVDDKGLNQKAPLAVVPAFSVMLEPGTQTIRVEGDPGCNVKVGVSYNLSIPAKGTLHLEVPPNWRVEPSQLPLEFHQRGEKQEFQFKVFPASLKEGRTEIRAVLDSGGTKYSEGYTMVTREDLDTFYYYQPAVQRVSIVDVKVAAGLKVGYIMGAGDGIPTVLQQLGIDVALIPAEKLGSEDLSRYGTIVLGIRAYDTHKEVAANNKRLLDFVSTGGTLIAQYNTGVGDFNSGHFTPYPTELSRARVSVEEAPVEILAPEDGGFHFPNAITARDFDGWVQERGLYFMGQWDSHFKPLLASHDPGEQPQQGGLLRAQYGKGTYIYTGYAFFRQLPAGVPGAIRLYVNLLSAGHERGSGQ